jgi:hypothetical protein
VDNPLTIVLGISAAGMTLLFLALLLFYGILSFMTSLGQERGRQKAEPEAPRAVSPGEDEEALRLRAAAIAVALARAGAAPGPAVDVPASQAVTPWWALHHQRRLNPTLRRRP